MFVPACHFSCAARSGGQARLLSLVTNNLNVALTLSRETEFRVVMTGGTVRSGDGAVLGQLTCDTLAQFRVDVAVSASRASTRTARCSISTPEEVRATRTIRAHAKTVFLVADHTKFSRRPMVRVGTLAQVHTLFTDRPVPEEAAALMREAGFVCAVA